MTGSRWPTQADLDLDALTGVEVVDAPERLERLREDGTDFLVTTADLDRSIDPSTRALGQLVRNCRVLVDDPYVTVIDLAECPTAP